MSVKDPIACSRVVLFTSVEKRYTQAFLSLRCHLHSLHNIFYLVMHSVYTVLLMEWNVHS